MACIIVFSLFIVHLELNIFDLPILLVEAVQVQSLLNVLLNNVFLSINRSIALSLRSFADIAEDLSYFDRSIKFVNQEVSWD